jgi:hypothetical protein
MAMAVLVGAAACSPASRKPPGSITVGPDGKAIYLVEFKAQSAPSDKLVSIFMDAFDQYGAKMPDAETGRTFPIDLGRKTPYSHGILYTQGFLITVTFVVTLAGEPGDIVSCDVTDRGAFINGSVQIAEIPASGTSASVRCVYTTPGA